MAAMVYYHGFWLAVLHVLTNGLTFFQSILSMNFFQLSARSLPCYSSILFPRPASISCNRSFSMKLKVVVHGNFIDSKSVSFPLTLRHSAVHPLRCSSIPSASSYLQQFSLQFIWLVHLRVLHSANY